MASINNTKGSVFISYRSTDRQVVQDLAKDIEDIGYNVWYDQEIGGGQLWWDAILANIRDCDIFVFALTPASIDSAPCRLEYTYAFDLRKPILPTLLTDGVHIPALPPALQAVNFVDYRNRTSRAGINLASALERLSRGVPLPEPLPEPPAAPIASIHAVYELLDKPTLTKEQQSAIALELKSRRDQQDDVDEILKLLKKLRDRGDTFLVIAREIDDIVAELRVRQATRVGEKSNTPTPTAARPTRSTTAMTYLGKPIRPARYFKPALTQGLYVGIMLGLWIGAGAFGIAQVYESNSIGIEQAVKIGLISAAVLSLLATYGGWNENRGRVITLPHLHEPQNFLEKIDSALKRHYTLSSNQNGLRVYDIKSGRLRQEKRLFIEIREEHFVITGPHSMLEKIKRKVY